MTAGQTPLDQTWLTSTSLFRAGNRFVGKLGRAPTRPALSADACGLRGEGLPFSQDDFMLMTMLTWKLGCCDADAVWAKCSVTRAALDLNATHVFLEYLSSDGKEDTTRLNLERCSLLLCMLLKLANCLPSNCLHTVVIQAMSVKSAQEEGPLRKRVVLEI